MKHKICMFCHNNKTEQKKRKLNTIRQLIIRHRVKPSSERYYFVWGAATRCEYGIPCSKLDIANSSINNLCREIEPYLISIARIGKEDLYYQILNLLRGDFPSVYKEMEKIKNNEKTIR